MEAISKVLLSLHVFAGFTSLVLFWLPVFTRKGGDFHVKIGKAYVWLMWIVVVTAAIMSIENLINGQITTAAFLGFLSLITANPLWYGIEVLKNKQKVSPLYRKVHLGFNILIVVSGIALIAYGIYLGGKGIAVLMFIFGILGISNIGQIVKAIKTPLEKANWFYDHMEGMLTTGIAAYTAFFAFGGRHFLEGLLTGYWSVIPWILPTVLGLIGIRYGRKKYNV